MKFVVGVAPSRNSIKDNHGVSEPWCKAAVSGQKVRRLMDGCDLEMRNARDSHPGDYLKSGRVRADRTPSKTEGFNLLESIAGRHSEDDHADVMLLGIGYWKQVADMAARKGVLQFKRGKVPIGHALPLLNDAGRHVGNAYILPHPRNWPMPAAYEQSAYRKKVLADLEKQKFKSPERNRVLLAGDYDTVFAKFGV